ncbi:MAG: DUF7341 domain-containing protein [Gammaproteobacteria bacterium]
MTPKATKVDEDAAALATAQAELAATIRELCEPRRVPVTQAGQLVVGKVPSWIQQLRESVAHGQGSGQGSGGSRVPINPGSVDTLTMVETAARQIHLRAYARSRRDTPAEADLRILGHLVACWSDVDQVTAVHKAVSRLLDAIRHQLDPKEEVPIDEPCPRCQQRMVWRWDSIGERLQAMALVLVVEDRIVTCRGCDSTWPAEFAGEVIREAAEHREAEARRLAAADSPSGGHGDGDGAPARAGGG